MSTACKSFPHPTQAKFDRILKGWMDFLSGLGCNFHSPIVFTGQLWYQNYCQKQVDQPIRALEKLADHTHKDTHTHKVTYMEAGTLPKNRIFENGPERHRKNDINFVQSLYNPDKYLKNWPSLCNI